MSQAFNDNEAEDHSWWAMASAPKDGTPVRILVAGRGEREIAAGPRYGDRWHEFPYTVLWFEGRWCFARNRAPLFPWQQPLRWKPNP